MPISRYTKHVILSIGSSHISSRTRNHGCNQILQGVCAGCDLKVMNETSDRRHAGNVSWSSTKAADGKHSFYEFWHNHIVLPIHHECYEFCAMGMRTMHSSHQ